MYILTRAADYAARVMIHLALLPPGTRVQRTALAEMTEVPESFMSKVLQGLVRARMIASKTGANGGFALAISPEEVSLLDIVEAMDGPLAVNVCVGAGQGCERHNWCGAHIVWLEAQEAITRVLKSATVARMAQQTALLRGTTAAAGDSGNISVIR